MTRPNARLDSAVPHRGANTYGSTGPQIDPSGFERIRVAHNKKLAKRYRGLFWFDREGNIVLKIDPSKYKDINDGTDSG